MKRTLATSARVLFSKCPPLSPIRPLCTTPARPEQQPFSLPPVVPLSNNRRLYFTDPRLAGYYYQIQQCLRQYGGKTHKEAKDMVDDSVLFSRVQTPMGVDLFCHEPPYYWAMMLLHGKEPGWHKKYWPPPRDEVWCEEFEFYLEEERGIGALDGETLFYKRVSREECNSTLFHGCSTLSAAAILENGISLTAGRLDLDFNPAGRTGFYLTKYIAQAKEWAMHPPRTAKEAAIVTYEVPVDVFIKYNILRFTLEEYEKWATFVLECRTRKLQHDYDAVEGPTLANPTSYVQNPTRFPALPRGNQIAIFSQKLASEFDKHILNVQEL